MTTPNVSTSSTPASQCPTCGRALGSAGGVHGCATPIATVTNQNGKVVYAKHADPTKHHNYCALCDRVHRNHACVPQVCIWTQAETRLGKKITPDVVGFSAVQSMLGRSEIFNPVSPEGRAERSRREKALAAGVSAQEAALSNTAGKPAANPSQSAQAGAQAPVAPPQATPVAQAAQPSAVAMPSDAELAAALTASGAAPAQAPESPNGAESTQPAPQATPATPESRAEAKARMAAAMGKKNVPGKPGKK